MTMDDLEKFVEIYRKNQDRKSFVHEAMKVFPKLKESSLQKKYVQVKKEVNIESIVKFNNKIYFEANETSQPPIAKLFMIDDMKRFNRKIDKEVLRKYGFSQPEINWLLYHNKIKQEYIDTDDESDEPRMDDEVTSKK